MRVDSGSLEQDSKIKLFTPSTLAEAEAKLPDTGYLSKEKSL
jgi:hypothetical protein